MKIDLLWEIPAIDYFLEHVDQIIVLPMNVSNDNDWFLHSEHIRLFLHDLCGCLDNFNKFLFVQSSFPKQVLSQHINVGDLAIAAFT